MRARQVLKLLQISRTTLYRYVQKNFIKVSRNKNGYYDYDRVSVFNFLNQQNNYNVIYARVSTYKQKNDLQRQINHISSYCSNNNIFIDHIYSDISSGMDLNRRHFSILLGLVFEYKIKIIFISNKDRLTRLSFITLKSIFEKF